MLELSILSGLALAAVIFLLANLIAAEDKLELPHFSIRNGVEIVQIQPETGAIWHERRPAALGAPTAATFAPAANRPPIGSALLAPTAGLHPVWPSTAIPDVACARARTLIRHHPGKGEHSAARLADPLAADVLRRYRCFAEELAAMR